MPPTIAKKKRESERKVPIRKRTRPMDMRMSRSRISAGADLKELHAQQLAQRGLIHNKSPPPVPPVPAIPEHGQLLSPGHSTTSDIDNVTVTEEPGSIVSSPAAVASPLPHAGSPDAHVDYSAIPPPPPLATSRSPEPTIQAPKPVTPDMPPAFKEPPPEDDDDYPPRPSFKEPPPERSDSPPLPNPHFPDERSSSPPLPMPSFADPPPEPASPPPAVSPTHFGVGGSRPTSPPSASSPRSASPVAAAKASLSRHSSVTSNTSANVGPRGARVAARGPRPSSGAVASMVGNFNTRGSAGTARPSSPASGGQARSPSRPTGHAKRSSASRASMFERRTMASDAEDEVVQ